MDKMKRELILFLGIIMIGLVVGYVGGIKVVGGF